MEASHKKHRPHVTVGRMRKKKGKVIFTVVVRVKVTAKYNTTEHSDS